MKKVFCVIITMILLSSSLFIVNLTLGEDNNLKSVNSEQFKNGYRYNVQGWIYLHIEGKPYDRGYQQGYLLSAEIVDMMNRWSNTIHEYPKFKFITGDISSPRYEKVSQKWWDFCRSRITEMYWNNYPEEYQQEINGIADGVNAKGEKLFGKAITSADILTLNEMYEFMTKLENPKKEVHPLRAFFHSLRQIIPGLSEKDENVFISTFLSQPKTYHCNGFIATGNATTDGQIVASQGVRCGGWWYSYDIAQRWNVILDIQPNEGNRLITTTSPGYIWSDENYYQNSNGIIIIDTTCPQGLWEKKGLSLAIRTRMAAQYSNSVDDVIYYLKHNQDGIWTSVWLIGDTKTGEITRLDLGLYSSMIWRTKNGFYWAANNAMAPNVRAEANGLGLKGSFYKILNISGLYGYYTRKYYPTPRDIKFKELGEKYYGSIDVDVLKKIMSTYPIVDPGSIDCKITDTTLVKNNGLWAFFGYLNGKEWNVSKLKSRLKGVKDVPPAGWALIYGLSSNLNYQLTHQSNYYYGSDEKILWDFTTNVENNIEYSSNAVSDDVVYSSTSSGMIYALDTYNGNLLWERNLSGKSAIAPVVYDNIVFVGLDNGLYALEKDDGKIKWSKNAIGSVYSLSAVGDVVIVGTDKGMHAFTCVNGVEKWENSTQAPAYISSSCENSVFVGCDKKCYAIDVENGRMKWVFNTNGSIASSPTVYKGTIYVGCWDTYLYAINAEDGKLKWKYETGWGVDNTPTARDGTVFFGSMDNNFYALDAENGKNLWTFTCQASIHSSPVTYGEYVFFGSDDGRFYALNRTTGNPVWFFAPGYSLQGDVYNYITTPILSNPVAYDKTIFLGVKGHIFALNAQTSEHPMVVVSEKFEITLSAWILIIIVLFAIIVITSFYFSRKIRK